jgi:two-component system OmpR family response regulator
MVVKLGFTRASQSPCHDGQVRVLVVEDDAALAEVIRRGLAEDGHGVDVEGSVVGAEHSAAENGYSLIILDLGLPDGDGLSLCRRLRDHGVQANILMLTARDTLTDKVGGLDAGADDYLTKPFDFPELAARVRALARRPVVDRATVLEAGDVRLDPAAHRVWRGAISVPLTAREFAVLQELLRHPGDVVTRTTLLEQVWDSNYGGFSNVVDVHIASLRRKLDLPGAPVPIETIRGVGYRINA